MQEFEPQPKVSGWICAHQQWEAERHWETEGKLKDIDADSVGMWTNYLLVHTWSSSKIKLMLEFEPIPRCLWLVLFSQTVKDINTTSVGIRTHNPSISCVQWFRHYDLECTQGYTWVSCEGRGQYCVWKSLWSATVAQGCILPKEMRKIKGML